MHDQRLRQDLARLFRRQRARIAQQLNPPERDTRAPVTKLGSVIVLTHRSAQGTRRHVDVDLPGDLTREAL